PVMAIPSNLGGPYRYKGKHVGYDSAGIPVFAGEVHNLPQQLGIDNMAPVAISGGGTAYHCHVLQEAGQRSALYVPQNAGGANTFRNLYGVDWADDIYLAIQVGKVADRTIADGHVSSGSPTLTSATANFVEGDRNVLLQGTDIPAGTTISTVTNSTTVTMSH